MGQGLRDYRDSERAHTVCGTLPCLRGRGPARSGSTRTRQDRAEQDSAHTGDEQPPDRGGFSAPSQPLTSHIPLLCICQRVFLSSLSAPRRSRAGRSEGSAHQEKASQRSSGECNSLLEMQRGGGGGGVTGLLEVGGEQCRGGAGTWCQSPARGEKDPWGQSRQRQDRKIIDSKRT